MINQVKINKLDSLAQVEQFLESFVWSNLYRDLDAHDPLRNIIKLCELLDNPQEKIKIIHVAGSKGKGSTSYMINQILLDHGYSTGLFTSPHLESYFERIQYNGQYGDDLELLNSINRIIDILNSGHIDISSLSCFEILTALSFDYFATKQVDYAIIEVGLGGKIDTTNIITPFASIITKIELEHTDILGDTLEQIATEKAGIIKSKIPVFVGFNHETVEQRMKYVAGENKSKLYLCSENVQINDFKLRKHGISFKLDHRGEELIIKSPLLTRIQANNIALAFIFFNALFPNISAEDVQQSVANITLKGRCELINYNQQPMIFDVAHTPKSIKALVKTVTELFPDVYKTVLFSCSTDKNITEIADLIQDDFEDIVLTSMQSKKSVDLEKIKQSFNDDIRVSVIDDNIQAITEILKNEHNGLVVICGSFYLVADVRKYILEQQQEK